MTKVLRPNMTQTAGLGGRSNTLSDWGTTKEYGVNDINSIQDPTSASAKYEITSIPSPFARIALVKEAFAKVVECGNLDGVADGNGVIVPTIYHKMVSDTLDVGQLFFNYESFQNKLEIIVWNRNTDLKNMCGSGTHHIVGTALDMYLKQDAKAYNFTNLNQVFLLRYKGPGANTQMDIVGATSSATIFFSSANDFSHISQQLPFGNGDYPFDGEYAPLYKRDFDYVKYLFALKATYQNFAADFPEVASYLNSTFGRLSALQQAQINNLDNTAMAQYKPIQVNGNTVSVFDNNVMPLHTHVLPPPVQSDFVINSTIFIGLQKPLVLPNVQGTKYTPLIYTSGYWTNYNCAPHQDSVPLINRILPQTAEQYPYLTISDFLEDYIIRMPYAMNANNFYAADFNNRPNENYSYALPVTQKFFDYFTVNELLGTAGNPPMITIQNIAGGVKVDLRIPIKGNAGINYMDYSRNYTLNATADAANNQGGIKDVTFGMIMLPLSHHDEVRVGLFNKDNNTTALSFFEDGTSVSCDCRSRRQGNATSCSIETYLVNGNFNRIQVRNNGKQNILVPLYPPKNAGGNTYKFAVDFGTTNTHIEYSVNGKNSMPFDITNNDVQVKRLHQNYGADIDIEDAIVNNFIPNTIGNNGTYNFPTRSIFSESINIIFNTHTDAFVDGNIPFRYGRHDIPSYNRAIAGLKWSSNATDQQRLSLYIETICILLRNKVLMNNGDLDATKIVWFYPTSMMGAHVVKLEAIWQNAYQKYFGNNTNNVISVSEAEAPCTYYRSKGGAANDVATIDIGGGTTDIYVMQGGQPAMQTSFRFGANSIFGDGYNSNPTLNGYVQKYSQQFENAMTANKLTDTLTAYNTVKTNMGSAEICSFLFGLKDLAPKVPALDFNNTLSNDADLKYPILVFHSALVYFLALQMKAKGIAKPNTLAFSGNGSKTLDILSPKPKMLEPLFKRIIEDVYNEHYDAMNGFNVIKESSPKTVTCKGGLLINNTNLTQVQQLKASLLGFDKQTFAGAIKYNDITQQQQQKLIKGVMEFINYLFDLLPDYQNNFALNGAVATKARQLCLNNLNNYLTDGINKRKQDVQNWGGDGIIDETLFFYPFVGMLNNVAYQLVINGQNGQNAN